MKLLAWLQKEGLSAKDLADRLGRDESTITRLIPGEGKKQVRKPGWDLLSEIHKETGGEVTANDWLDVGDETGGVEPKPTGACCT